VPLDQSKIKRWKEKHSEGEVYEMILSDDESTGSTPLAKKFHAVRDDYARVNGMTNDHAKIELKHNYGVVYPIGQPPTGRLVRLITETDVRELGGHIREVEYHDLRELQLSITDYTTEELQRLVQGSELALSEARV
jgi:hypothetical protein